MAKKQKKKIKEPVERNAVAVAAKARNSAGPMQSKSTKRKRGRKAWRKDLDKLISGE